MAKVIVQNTGKLKKNILPCRRRDDSHVIKVCGAADIIILCIRRATFQARKVSIFTQRWEHQRYSRGIQRTRKFRNHIPWHGTGDFIRKHPERSSRQGSLQHDKDRWIRPLHGQMFAKPTEDGVFFDMADIRHYNHCTSFLCNRSLLQSSQAHYLQRLLPWTSSREGHLSSQVRK